MEFDTLTITKLIQSEIMEAPTDSEKALIIGRIISNILHAMDAIVDALPKDVQDKIDLRYQMRGAH